MEKKNEKEKKTDQAMCTAAVEFQFGGGSMGGVGMKVGVPTTVSIDR